MDPIRNPYAPGAGTPPPELAGRSDLIASGTAALRRVSAGRPHQSMLMVGLRGVGKTVLLNRFAEIAEVERCKIAFVEAHEGKTLPELLAPSIRSICHSLSVVHGAKDMARRALRALKGFMSGLKVTGNDMDFGLSIDAESGLADSGNLETHLPALVSAVGEAAKAARRSFALMIDELQYLDEREFSTLIMSIHRCNQRNLPVLMIGAGLPQITALAGNSKSYSERLFKFPEIGICSSCLGFGVVAACRTAAARRA